MPSQAALERGSAVAHGIIDSHKQANAGAYPETVAVRADGPTHLKLPRVHGNVVQLSARTFRLGPVWVIAVLLSCLAVPSAWVL